MFFGLASPNQEIAFITAAGYAVIASLCAGAYVLEPLTSLKPLQYLSVRPLARTTRCGRVTNRHWSLALTGHAHLAVINKH
jgi:hypothetical protein